MIEGMVVLLTSYSSMVWFQFYVELVLFQGMGMGFEDKTMLHCFREIVKRQQGFTPGIRYQLYNSLGQLKQTCASGQMVNKSDINSSRPKYFPGQGKHTLLFSSDIVNLQLNINVGRDRRSSFVIFVIWSTLIVGELVLVGCSWWRGAENLVQDQLKSHLLCSWFYSRIGDAG